MHVNILLLYYVADRHLERIHTVLGFFLCTELRKIFNKLHRFLERGIIAVVAP